MATGTQLLIGFYPATQRPVDERYLNEGSPYATTAAVLAAIPLLSRHPYLTVNIAGVDYWFSADMTSLSVKTQSSNQTAAQMGIVDSGDLFTATNVEGALQELAVTQEAIIESIGGITGVNQTVFTINLAAGALAARVAAAVETVSYPTGWMLAVSGGTNLLVTHTLTGRKVAGVNVFEIDGANERLLPPFSAAYTGIMANAMTVLIEGFAPTSLSVRVELFFNL